MTTHGKTSLPTLILALLATTAWLGPVAAAGSAEEREEAKARTDDRAADASTAGVKKTDYSERVRVVGSPDKSAKIPGSVSYLGEDRLERQDYADIHRVLSQVPGVNIQEEEGYGLRPNIGFRGSGADRSSKITLMEDGVLIAPAPYSAPSAYYFPTTGRMDGVEVRKGSSSIQQGPFTTAGVLNLISAAIPSSLGGSLNLATGDDATIRGRARLGSSTDRFGWLVESYRLETDGFKRLDGGGPTGVDLEDYMVKMRVTGSPEARRFQALEIKLGKTEQLAHETYLGLAREDFDRTPYRRYAASREDRLDTDHEQVQLRYFLKASRNVDFTATVYNNDFARNWRKLDSVGGAKIGDVLDDPATYAPQLSLMRGESDSLADALMVRNNRRDYFSRGIHALLGIQRSGQRVRHDVELGVRYHEDEEDRFQEEDGFAITSGQMISTSLGAPGSQSNRINSASAWAIHLQDTISFSRWTLTPGARVELIDFERIDYGKNDPTRSGFELSRRTNDVSELIPGIGATFRFDDNSRLFAGIHRGFAPPGPGATEETDPEESVNYELGYRRTQGALEMELVGFYNDYRNLLGEDTLSAGGTGDGDRFNGGAVVARGIETSLSYDVGAARGLGVGLPINFTYTYTSAEFRTAFESDFAAWGEVEVGDRLPYVPEHQASLGIGLVRGKWKLFSNVIYQDRMRTKAGQGPFVPEESTDAHLLVDLSVDYRVHPKLRLLAQVRNLTDDVYVAARRPAGLRPGLPRTVLAGLALDF